MRYKVKRYTNPHVRHARGSLMRCKGNSFGAKEFMVQSCIRRALEMPGLAERINAPRMIFYYVIRRKQIIRHSLLNICYSAAIKMNCRNAFCTKWFCRQTIFL